MEPAQDLAAVDQAKTARDLEWAELLESFAGLALNTRTADRIRQLLPLGSRGEAERHHTWVRELRVLSDAGRRLPLRATPDIGELVDRLRVGGAGSGEQLAHTVHVIEQAERLNAHAKEQRELCPTLLETLPWNPKLSVLRDQLHAALDEQGRLYDHASEALATARRSLTRLRDQVREEQARLLAKHRQVLAGAYFAERGGRYVLPVRTDAGNVVDGTVLGSSGSGSTLYVEPRELTQKNNELHICEARVATEETRLLETLSRAAAEHLPALEQAVANCDRADYLGAIARWAEQHHAEPVQFAEQPTLTLRQMRHPLLLANGAESVVPSDLRLAAGEALIISGPNAGGKTVALKCLGLAVWMARSGLPVPCGPGSAIGWFDTVLSDIGDDQSLSRSLSTFSAHVSHLARYLECAERGILVLLDEVAGGTDPDEGAALAVAVLEALAARGAAVATTTHYERLKQLGASDAARYANASVGFDLKRMLPTFRVTLGIPGASSALAVAARFGIPAAIVERAETLMPREHLSQQRLLDQLEQQRAELTRERVEAENAARDQLGLAEKRDAEHARALDRERAELRSQATELTRELLTARNLLEQAKLQLRSDGLTRQALESVERMVSAAAAPVMLGGSVTQMLQARPAPSALPLANLEPGTRVFLPHLNAEAEVLARPDKQQLRVSVSGLKMTVPLSQVQASRSSNPQGTPRKSEPKRPETKRHDARAKAARRTALDEVTSYVPVRTSNNVCDLRGVRVEAGLEQVDAFLDQMLRLSERAVFILHGHGTGAMRTAVREHLTAARFVERWHPADPDDGGDALTVVWLR